MLLTNATRMLGLVLLAQAAPLSVSELLANAERFNGQPVTVSGTINSFRANPWRRGNPMYTFDLSDGTEIVLVTEFAEPPCRSGTATVEGTYRAVKGRVNASYSWKEITAHKVICLPNTADPRGPKGK
jgi:DNA polymerase III alpha subunit